MQYSLTLAALAGASLTMAAPTETKGFSVHQVANGHKFKNGALSMMKSYNKYSNQGAVAPDHLVKAAQVAATQQGTVAANPQQYDSEYLSPVTVGSQTLNLDFDTGSSDLWVFSTEQSSSQRSGHTAYNPSISGTAESGETWSISYGDQSSASGNVFKDKVVVGGVTSNTQDVEAAQKVSSQFVSDNADGLLGLGFASINTCSPKKCTTFFDNVKSTLPQQLFTATLKHNKAGSYDFGYLDSSKYTGSISYVPVSTSRGFWEFTAGSASTNGKSSGSIGDAIADTGTTLLIIPDSAASAYYTNVRGAQNSQSEGGYIFPCSSTLPDWTVQIGSGTFTVPGSYINYAPASGGNCFGGIQAKGSLPFSIFGDIFLKAQYVVFDQTTSSPRLGFAKQA